MLNKKVEFLYELLTMLPTVMEVTIAVNLSLELNQIVRLVKGTGSKLSEHVNGKGKFWIKIIFRYPFSNRFPMA